MVFSETKMHSLEYSTVNSLVCSVFQPCIQKRFDIFIYSNIFWLGDLNYRLAPGYNDTPELFQKQDWDSLLERDQVIIDNA